MSWFKKSNWSNQHPSKAPANNATPKSYRSRDRDKNNWSPDKKRRMPERTNEIYDYYHGDDEVATTDGPAIGKAQSADALGVPQDLSEESTLEDEMSIDNDINYYRIKDLYQRLSRLKKLLKIDQKDVIQLVVEQTGEPIDKVTEIARSRKSY